MTVAKTQRVSNLTLRHVRIALRMSQAYFAEEIRHAGEALGEPNTASKRLVQRWESGEHRRCHANYKRALEASHACPSTN
jgi:hypothetical protein